EPQRLITPESTQDVSELPPGKCPTLCPESRHLSVSEKPAVCAVKVTMSKTPVPSGGGDLVREAITTKEEREGKDRTPPARSTHQLKQHACDFPSWDSKLTSHS
ncbi:hypothetical protein P7K49_019095, partial [Saguinus oedipus]